MHTLPLISPSQTVWVFIATHKQTDPWNYILDCIMPSDWLLSVASIVLFRTVIYSEQHVLLMWSVAFYIAEHFIHELKEMDFVSRLFQVSAV